MNKSINLISGILGLFFMAVIVFLFFYAAAIIIPFILVFFGISVLGKYIVNFFNSKDEVEEAIVYKQTKQKVNKKAEIIDADYEIIDEKDN